MTARSLRLGTGIGVALVIAGVIAAIGTAVAARDRGPVPLADVPEPSLTAPVLVGVRSRVVALVEGQFRDQVTHDAGGVTCAALPFGVEPATATRVDEVTAVYSWVFCRGTDASAVMMPVAIGLGGTPTIQVPDSGEGYPDSLDRIFPARVRVTAIHQPRRQTAALVAEVDARAGATPSPSPSVS